MCGAWGMRVSLCCAGPVPFCQPGQGLSGFWLLALGGRRRDAAGQERALLLWTGNSSPGNWVALRLGTAPGQLHGLGDLRQVTYLLSSGCKTGSGPLGWWIKEAPNTPPQGGAISAPPVYL